MHHQSARYEVWRASPLHHQRFLPSSESRRDGAIPHKCSWGPCEQKPTPGELPPSRPLRPLGRPDGLAYLFLQVSHMYPDIIISGSNAISWAHSYIRGSRRNPQLDPGCCGIGSEKLAFAAVQAAVTKDLDNIQNFVADVPAIVDGSGGNIPNELLYGRAGALYLMRMMRHWVPGSAPLLAGPIEQVSRRILADGPGWTWHGKRYLGAVHGDIGIVTQLVLTTPALASQLGSVLDRLLELQVEDGNWPSSERREASSSRLTQFCHGAPGFIMSLRSLRPFFPGLQARIDEAVQKGCECVWSKGLLRKEPSLCHGIFGNAL